MIQNRFVCHNIFLWTRSFDINISSARSSYGDDTPQYIQRSEALFVNICCIFEVEVENTHRTHLEYTHVMMLSCVILCYQLEVIAIWPLTSSMACAKFFKRRKRQLFSNPDMQKLCTMIVDVFSGV